MYPQFGNYSSINLASGTTATTNVTYYPGGATTTSSNSILGDGITGASVNRFYCVSAGTMTITMIGGGTFTTPTLNPTNEFYAIANKVVVNNGLFIGFKPRMNWGHQRTTPFTN